MAKNITSVCVSVVIKTNKIDYELDVIPNEDESCEDFAQRGKETVEELLQRTSDEEQ